MINFSLNTCWRLIPTEKETCHRDKSPFSNLYNNTRIYCEPKNSGLFLRIHAVVSVLQELGILGMVNPHVSYTVQFQQTLRVLACLGNKLTSSLSGAIGFQYSSPSPAISL